MGRVDAFIYEMMDGRNVRKLEGTIERYEKKK